MNDHELLTDIYAFLIYKEAVRLNMISPDVFINYLKICSDKVNLLVKAQEYDYGIIHEDFERTGNL